MREIGYSHMAYYPSFWPEGFISLLINFLVWGVLIYLAVHLIRKLASCHHGGCCGGNCGVEDEDKKGDSYYLSIAKERYAKGEIDKKHFDDLKREFSSSSKEEMKEELDKEGSKE